MNSKLDILVKFLNKLVADHTSRKVKEVNYIHNMVFGDSLEKEAMVITFPITPFESGMLLMMNVAPSQLHSNN